MASQKVVKLLNDQVALEGNSSQIYLAMAVWAEANGWLGTARFMYAQAEEERQHMIKIIRFLNEIAALPVVPAVAAPKVAYDDIEAAFTTALKHEETVTAAIYAMMSAARETGDYAVTNLMQWFVGEQVEEEATARLALDIIAKAGKVSVYLADKEIGSLRDRK